MKLQSLNGTTGVAGRSSEASARFSVTANFSEGRILLRGDRDLRGAKLLDLQGRTLATWNAVLDAGHSLSLDARGIERGMYLVEVSSARGRTTANLLVP